MEKHNFDLDEEMLSRISKDFGPASFVKALKPQDPKGLTSSFEDYGRRLARRSIEEGEERVDRTYEIMKEAIEKTGEMRFPFIPQRYIEIAYLSIQPFKRLWVVINHARAFVFRINECSIYQAITNEHGEELAQRMICKAGCLGLIEEIFSHFGFQAKSFMEVGMERSGYCQFRVERE